MKLHGNAALSWSGRRRLAERVIVEGGRWGLQVAVAGCATAGFGWLAWSRVFDPRDREALRSALQMGLPGRGGRQ